MILHIKAKVDQESLLNAKQAFNYGLKLLLHWNWDACLQNQPSVSHVETTCAPTR